jgi:hypothetical protein
MRKIKEVLQFEQLNDMLPINNALPKSRYITSSIPCVHTACQ